ncbi:hypothetical protein kac65v162_gp200 [Nodularia phage vB_NspS-kac65v162]|uniref:Uncharacterized protein n=3 Tax=Ravarandavirus kac65v151 TaxID=2845689 RepID=A0A482MIK1_9CAUD|nr:hypothetical protein HWC12_gp117 [Nodularia phage vB_NspS-kac65v151]QBQ73230.1 hypothetical protein kac65v151_gp200 [Nodularia phage vB_NspS-kac65v151]QBQ73438.1 hypothetical protein kac65v161_gp200 [Nodularia phage vB_NspS-kac65v161]QBQ73644.1 hypothetical protein kac65v162_gp200 [Nodularia phage vB_NspS-kac65v162]
MTAAELFLSLAKYTQSVSGSDFSELSHLIKPVYFYFQFCHFYCPQSCIL